MAFWKHTERERLIYCNQENECIRGKNPTPSALKSTFNSRKEQWNRLGGRSAVQTQENKPST